MERKIYIDHIVCKLGMKNANFKKIDQHKNVMCQM
jgi:hypothetical protein